MPKKKATPEPSPEASRRTRDTVSQVAHALRHRDEIVQGALEFLEASGFVAPETRDEVLRAYEVGDTATRLAVQELLSRVLRVPLEALGDELAEGELDPARVSKKHLKALEELRLPQVDIDAMGERIRAFDVEGFIARHAGDTKLVTFITDVPVKLNALRIGLLFGGILIMIVAAAALLFPQYAAWIAFYGLIGFLVLLGAFMVTWAVRLERGSRDLGIDLVVFARLDPEERRILVLRRLILGITDTQRIGDLVEKGLHSMVPERMQAPKHREAPPRRPIVAKDTGAAGAVAPSAPSLRIDMVPGSDAEAQAPAKEPAKKTAKKPRGRRPT